MDIPNKGSRDSSPFRVSDYPREFPHVSGKPETDQAKLDRWFYDFKTVLLRERENLLKSITEVDVTEDFASFQTSTNARLDALEAAVDALTIQVSNISSSLSTTVGDLAAHIAATVAHGSNGAVAGLNDLLAALSANGFVTMDVNASGVTAVAFADNVRTGVVAATFTAGAGAYNWTVNLSDADRTAGDVIHFKAMLPASTNPTLVIKDLATGSDLVTFTHDGTAGFLNIIFVFNSDLNWYVHSMGSLEAL